MNEDQRSAVAAQARAKERAEKGEPEPEPEEPTGSRRLDPELRTMGAMLRMLDDLDDKARARVVLYLSSRYQ